MKESVIREMTRKAKKYDAVNLSQGYPEYPTPKIIKEAAKNSINEDINQYSITWGLEELRQMIARKLTHFNGLSYDPEMEITITCGTSEAIMSSVLGLVDREDEVLTFQPFYENYVPAISIADGKAVFTTIDNELNIDFEDIKEKVNNKTKAMIINTPHNPTGKVFSKEDLKFLRDVCIDNDTIAITDEIYERIIFEGDHLSPASLDDMWERTVTIGGFSKAYSVTGWRVGYAAAPKDLMKSIRKVHDYTTVCAPTPFQKALIVTSKLLDEYYNEMVSYYKDARDFLYERLSRTPLEPSLPYGAYYMMANIDSYDMNDLEFTDYLVKEKGVAVVPGSSFYDEGGKDLVRFCFSQDMDQLKEAVERLIE
ncbi:MAG: pyridoxal phosphate-dependent aminotransferase [Thermoplasmatota archaeon]